MPGTFQALGHNTKSDARTDELEFKFPWQETDNKQIQKHRVVLTAVKKTKPVDGMQRHWGNYRRGMQVSEGVTSELRATRQKAAHD